MCGCILTPFIGWRERGLYCLTDFWIRICLLAPSKHQFYLSLLTKKKKISSQDPLWAFIHLVEMECHDLSVVSNTCIVIWFSLFLCCLVFSFIEQCWSNFPTYINFLSWKRRWIITQHSARLLCTFLTLCWCHCDVLVRLFIFFLMALLVWKLISMIAWSNNLYYKCNSHWKY